MDPIVWLYIINLSLLILHEIESAYWKEWEILNLPGGISGFLIIHLPLLILFLFGLIKLYDAKNTGYIISLITGLSGIIPFLVHNIWVRVKGKFQLFVSQLIIYFNLVTGIALILLSLIRIN